MSAVLSEILSGTLMVSALVLTLTFLVIGAKAYLQPGKPVSITVNEARIVPGTAGQTLFSALGAAGYRLPGTCGGKGTCGLCRTMIAAGGGEPLPAEVARLSRRDLRDHMRLACQVVLRNDLSIGLPGSMLDAVAITGQIESARFLSPLIREIVIAIPPGSGLEPEAGSFVEIEAPPFELRFAGIALDPRFQDYWQHLGLAKLKAANSAPVTRAYSVANRPHDSDRVILNIRLALPPPGQDAPPGIVSSYLFGLSPGDPIAVRGPFGNFRVQDTNREMIFIGGGVGMAPLRAMIFDELERKSTERKVSYWYGARSRIDLFYADEFEALAARHVNFRWTAALSEPQPEDGWTGPTGFIHSVLRKTYLDDHPAPEDCEYYLCGPPMMIRSVRVMLEDLGVEAENVFFDDFGG